MTLDDLKELVVRNAPSVFADGTDLSLVWAEEGVITATVASGDDEMDFDISLAEVMAQTIPRAWAIDQIRVRAKATEMTLAVLKEMEGEVAYSH